jgi:hypothetical protein
MLPLIGEELIAEDTVTSLTLFQPVLTSVRAPISDYFNLIEFIEFSGTLRRLCLQGICDFYTVQFIIHHGLTNLGINSLELIRMIIEGPWLFRLLRAITCRKITLDRIDSDNFVHMDQAMDSVPFPVRLPFVGSIEDFCLFEIEDHYLIPLLHELTSFTNLKKLHLLSSSLYIFPTGERPLSAPLSRSISMLVKFSPNLEVLHLSKYIFTATSMEPIADCFVNAGSSFLKQLVIDSCVFDLEARQMFESVITSADWKIPSLELRPSLELDGARLAELVVRILTMKPINSALKRLVLSSCQEYFTFMKPLENEATLDYLELGEVPLYQLGDMPLYQWYKDLMSTLIELRGLKKLSINLIGSMPTEPLRAKTLRCLLLNHCLEEISISRIGTPGLIFEDEVNRCCNRNKCIKAWLFSPEAVLDSYLPYIIEKANKCWYSEEIVMKGLMASWMKK